MLGGEGRGREGRGGRGGLYNGCIPEYSDITLGSVGESTFIHKIACMLNILSSPIRP